MASSNFESCLAVTLKWEGNYSNHPDDPGGPTMKGVIQREYDAWRKKQGKGPRPVRQIEDGELNAIYRTQYWDAMGCDELDNRPGPLRFRCGGEFRGGPGKGMAGGRSQHRWPLRPPLGISSAPGALVARVWGRLAKARRWNPR